MNQFFKFVFEQVTDPLCLPIDPISEWIILGIIGLIAYGISFLRVGDLYDTGLISGKTAGSFFHWIIRAFVFIALWFATNCVLHAYLFFRDNWQLVFMIAASVGGTIAICVLTVLVMRYIIKCRNARKSV